MEKHYWKKNEIVFLKECYEKSNGKFEKLVSMFNAKYPSIEEEQIKRALYEYKITKD